MSINRDKKGSDAQTLDENSKIIGYSYHGRRRYAFPIRLSRGDNVKVGPRGDNEVCLSYIYSYD